ncbi:MAG: hypothetical protein IKZ96_01810 [Bacilli bacterium]|nr:hypothetical protein [Bacilli bacterium]
MKRMKRILCTLLIVVSVLLLCACKKDVSPITYKRFISKMSDDLSYSVTDKSLSYEGIYERYISASKEGSLFLFMEFEDEKTAKKYMEDNYKKQKGYSYKSTDDYIVVTNSKGGYVKLVQVNNIIISGSTEQSKYKTDIKKAFKELGY